MFLKIDSKTRLRPRNFCMCIVFPETVLILILPRTITCAVLLRPEESCLAPVEAEGGGALALGAAGGHRHRHHVTRQRGPGGARHAHYYRKILLISPCDHSPWMEAPD